MAGFMENYGTANKCHAALAASVLACSGFDCPKCGSTHPDEQSLSMNDVARDLMWNG